MEYLYLKWIDYRTNKKHLIGALFRDKEKGKYYFKLSKSHVEKALKEKAISEIILPFSDYDKIYEIMRKNIIGGYLCRYLIATKRQ